MNQRIALKILIWAERRKRSYRSIRWWEEGMVIWLFSSFSSYEVCQFDVVIASQQKYLDMLLLPLLLINLFELPLYPKALISTTKKLCTTQPYLHSFMIGMVHQNKLFGNRKCRFVTLIRFVEKATWRININKQRNRKSEVESYLRKLITASAMTSSGDKMSLSQICSFSRGCFIGISRGQTMRQLNLAFPSSHLFKFSQLCYSSVDFFNIPPMNISFLFCCTTKNLSESKKIEISKNQTIDTSREKHIRTIFVFEHNCLRLPNYQPHFERSQHRWSYKQLIRKQFKSIINIRTTYQ